MIPFLTHFAQCSFVPSAPTPSPTASPTPSPTGLPTPAPSSNPTNVFDTEYTGPSTELVDGKCGAGTVLLCSTTAGASVSENSISVCEETSNGSGVFVNVCVQNSKGQFKGGLFSNCGCCPGQVPDPNYVVGSITSNCQDETCCVPA